MNLLKLAIHPLVSHPNDPERFLCYNIIFAWVANVKTAVPYGRDEICRILVSWLNSCFRDEEQLDAHGYVVHHHSYIRDNQ